MNASRMATLFFGASPYASLSVTQQVESNFGQSWPTLVYLPSVAFTSSTARALAGGDARAVRQLLEALNTVGWHEMAHQWWGHQVGWASYRDQWLSEGLAEFTAALTLEAVEGAQAYDDFWEARRTDILARTSPVANDDAGAIAQGFRLATRRSPGAASAMVYAKGAYVAHMIRMMMRSEGQPNPDAAFQAMMQDFVRTWAGRSPSTDDFQQVVERHLNATPGGLDFFFDQWVRGTDIPTLRSTVEVTDLGGGRYRMSGTVSQEGVPQDFRTIAPVYLDFGENRLARIGAVTLIGTQGQAVSQELALPRAPRGIVINARHDVLAR
jgi:aminopeptidase N